MKQTWQIGMLFLIAVLTLGCSNESERMANMAERVSRSQNDVNSNLAKANDNFVELNKELQKERIGLQNERLVLTKEIQKERNGLQHERLTLNDQFERLEQDRHALHRQRRSEVAWSESFQFLAIVIAAVMPLFLCAYLIWIASQSSVQQEEVNSILLNELVAAEPRLIAAPNLAAIEHRRSDNQRSKENEELTNHSFNRRK